MSAPTLIHHRVELARNGENPKVICRVKSGWVVLGDVQNIRGYALLLGDPIVGSINDLDREGRAQFSNDMYAVGDALLATTHAHRINYNILGNLEGALHAHINPRYDDEPIETRGRMLPSRFEDTVSFDYERDAPLMERLRNHLVHNNFSTV